MSWFVKTKRAQTDTDDEKWVEGLVAPTLNAFDLGDTRAVVLVLKEAEMDTYPIQGTVIGRKDTAGPQGKGYGEQDDPMFTLDTTGGHAVAMVDVSAYDEYNDSLGGEVHQALRAGTKQSTGVLITGMNPEEDPGKMAEKNPDVAATLRSGGDGRVPSSRGEHLVVAPTLSASNNPSRSPQSSEVTAQVEAMVNATSIVRRLTPVECERLQGFPDNWTLVTEKTADSHRYKQMGNAVTVNVLEWLGSRL